MLKAQEILEQLTGNHIVNTLVKTMEEIFEDFAEDKKRYCSAMCILQKELGNSTSPSVADEMEAIHKQAASTLLFSGLLGLKANLDHFIDPVAKNFLDVDFDVFLREDTAHRLPEYVNAQQTRDRFYTQLSPAQRESYEDVIVYTCHLETIGPKLAHYYGYILGNDLLSRVVPGYHADTVQTSQYTAMLKKYFGKSFE